MAKKIQVIQDDSKPVPIEVMAQSIRSISSGIKKLLAGPLNSTALILLIQNACPSGSFGGRKPTRKEVEGVLDGIESLERAYLKPMKPGKK